MATLTKAEIEDWRSSAEDAIEDILNELENRIGCKISHVTVDTRNFANYDCEITFQDRHRR